VAPGSGGGSGPASSSALYKNNESTLTHRPSTFIQKVFRGSDVVPGPDKDILEEHGVDQKPLLLMDDN
jgi:hypothetical protein